MRKHEIAGRLSKSKAMATILTCLLALLAMTTVYGLDPSIDNSDKVPVDMEIAIGETQSIVTDGFELATFHRDYACWNGNCAVPFFLKNNRDTSFSFNELKLKVVDEEGLISDVRFYRKYYGLENGTEEMLKTEELKEPSLLSVDSKRTEYFEAHFRIPKGSSGKFNIELWSGETLLIRLDPYFYWQMNDNTLDGRNLMDDALAQIYTTRDTESGDWSISGEKMSNTDNCDNGFHFSIQNESEYGEPVETNGVWNLSYTFYGRWTLLGVFETNTSIQIGNDCPNKGYVVSPDQGHGHTYLQVFGFDNKTCDGSATWICGGCGAPAGGSTIEMRVNTTTIEIFDDGASCCIVDKAEYGIPFNITQPRYISGWDIPDQCSTDKGSIDDIRFEYEEIPDKPPEIENNLTSIDPATIANAESNLSCTFTPLDEDAGDTLTGYVRWYKDGEIALTQSRTVTNGTQETFRLDSGNTTKSEVWYCSAQVYDGEEYTEWIDSPETNIMPTIKDQEVTISPAPTAKWYSDLNCTFTPYGEGSLSATVEWYENGVYQFSNDRVVTNDTEELFVLNGDNTTVEGAIWKCRVRISDNGVNSKWFNSSDVELTNNKFTYGNHTITRDLIVNNLIYVYREFEDFVLNTAEWVMRLELSGTDIVAGVGGRNWNGRPQLFVGATNETSERVAAIGIDGDNALLFLTENTTAVNCSEWTGGIIFSAGRHYGCDGVAWHALY